MFGYELDYRWPLRRASLPYFIAHFLGYRRPGFKQKKLKLWRNCVWSFLGAWLSIGLLEIMFMYAPLFRAHRTPFIIGSYGAATTLLYGAYTSPTVQPPNVIFGHLIGSFIGVAISKLFTQTTTHWASTGQEEAVLWVAGASAMALTLVCMEITNTVHPPAGAAALIACVDKSVIDIGWYYMGVIMLSSTILLVLACLINNIERHYPVYWWQPRAKNNSEHNDNSTAEQNGSHSPTNRNRVTPVIKVFGISPYPAHVQSAVDALLEYADSPDGKEKGFRVKMAGERASGSLEDVN